MTRPNEPNPPTAATPSSPNEPNPPIATPHPNEPNPPAATIRPNEPNPDSAPATSHPNEPNPAPAPGFPNEPNPATPSGPSWERDPGGAAETIEANWLFRLRRERFISRTSGRSHDFFVMHLADAVQAVAVTPVGEVVLVRQFRAGSGLDSLEPPGGLTEPGEDPRDAAARELLEETGYAGDPAVLLGSSWSNPSLMTSRISTVLIANARKVAEPKLDVGEEVNAELVPARAIPAMIRSGAIGHALSVLGLLLWLETNPNAVNGPAERPA